MLGTVLPHIQPNHLQYEYCQCQQTIFLVCMHHLLPIRSLVYSKNYHQESRPMIWKKLQASSPINSDRSSETLVGILQKAGFPNPEPHHLEHNLSRLACKMLSVVFCCALLSTWLLCDANRNSSSVTYHKWGLMLFATALAIIESVPPWCVISVFMSKRSFLVQRTRLLQIATELDSGMLKTEQNVIFWVVQMQMLSPWGAEMNLVDLGNQF